MYCLINLYKDMAEEKKKPDNLEQFFETGSTNTHNINISKAGKFGSIRTSLTYQNHDAVVPNSDFNQYTANIGSRLKISEKLNAEIALSYIKFHRKNSPSLGDDNNASFGKGISTSIVTSFLLSRAFSFSSLRVERFLPEN